MAIPRQYLPPALDRLKQFPQRNADTALERAGHGQLQGGGGQRDALLTRRDVHGPQRHLPHPAARHVDDALERQVIGGLVQHAHVGDGVAYLRPFVEPQPADDAVGDAERDHPLLERAGLGTGADQDRAFGQLVPVPPQRLDPVADHAGLLVGIPQADDVDLLSLRIVAPGPQRLAQPPLVVGDQPGGGGEDGRGGAVVALQLDDLGSGEVLLEAKNVLHLGAAPRVYRLIVIANATNVLVPLRQQPQPQVLHQVGVLVLVHEDVAEAAVVVGQDFGLGPQDLRHVQQQVAEIGGVELLQAVLVGAVQRAGQAAGEVAFLPDRNPVRRQATVLPALDHAHQGRGGPTLRVEVGGLHHLFQQAQLVVAVQDGEAGRQAHKLRMAAQHAGAQGVEGAEPQALRRAAQQVADALPHLLRGLVGERHRQHLARCRLALQQDMGEARRQHAGLAGAGAGQHQHGAVHGLHRFALLGVQAGEVFGHDGGMRRIPGI